MSYELRTPLTNIIGFSELLASPIAGPLTDRQREYLNDIRLSGRTLLAIIDDILDLATIDAGTLELKLSPVKVRDVIDAGGAGRARAAEAERHVALDIAIEPGIDEFVADGRRVTQMLYNLLSNAIGFSDAGGKIALGCGRENSMLAFTVDGSGRRHPRRLSAGRVRPLREPPARLAPSRRWGSGFPSSRASPSCMAARSRSTPAPGRGTRVTLLLPLKQQRRRQTPPSSDEPRYRSSLAG